MRLLLYGWKPTFMSTRPAGAGWDDRAQLACKGSRSSTESIGLGARGEARRREPEPNAAGARSERRPCPRAEMVRRSILACDASGRRVSAPTAISPTTQSPKAAAGLRSVTARHDTRPGESVAESDEEMVIGRASASTAMVARTCLGKCTGPARDTLSALAAMVGARRVSHGHSAFSLRRTAMVANRCREWRE